MEIQEAIEKLREFCKLRAFCELYPDACQKDKCEIYMAIEALNQSQSNDLISRSKTIRWVKAECNPYGQPTLDYESGIKVIEHLERMSSAQPEIKTDGDTISRQATYLALVEKGQASKRYKLGETWELNGKEIREVLDALPSVQPEPRTDGDTISRRGVIMLPVMPKEHREYQTHNLDDAYEQGWFDLQKCIEKLPSTQPDNRIAEIADLVEGTIDHYDLDDAMDLIYQIKEIIKNE